MEKELDPSIIKATQTSLGKYVKRPPLSEKLLKKPPFRFLHDIITTVLKNTGFFEGLFEQEELISDNVKDRDSKISFLNKVIAVVGETTGKTLSVKSTKIVAGQEPEKTNELLQCLANALDQKLSSEEAVKKYKDGIKQPQKEKKTKEPTIPAKKSNNEGKKLTSKSNEKLTKDKKDTSVKKEKEISNSIKTKSKESSIKKETVQKKSSQPSTKTLTPKNILQNENKVTNKKENASKEDVKVSGIDEPEAPVIKRDNTEIKLNYPEVVNSEVEKNENEPNDELKNNLSSESYIIDDNEVKLLSPQELQKESLTENIDEVSNKTDNETEKNVHLLKRKDSVPKELNQNQNKKNVDNVINEDDKSQVRSIDTQDYSKNRQEKEVFSENANDFKSNITYNAPTNNNIARPPSVRPPSSRPGAPRVREKHDNIINSTENVIVGKVNIITENNPNEEEEDSSFIVDEQTMAAVDLQDMQELHLATNQHGHLVQQILNSQKELSQIAGKTEIEWQFGAQKAREAMNQEIDQLKFNIQALSRIANPLGKLLDHIQEDVEVMRQELQQWIGAFEEASKELSKEKSKNEDSLFPLRTKLKQLDADIAEKHDKINDLKVVIHKNSSRIDKLLASGKVQ